MAIAVFEDRLTRRAGVWPAGLLRTAAVLAMAGALVTGFVLTGHAAAARAAWRDGPDLARLLRAMAVLKMLMAAAVSAGVLWRLGSPARPLWLAGYGAATLAMWAGPGLIWDLSHLGAGALLLHGGLAGALVLLWRDPVAGARLAVVIARKARGSAPGPRQGRALGTPD
jgi:hypothetical protein